MFSRCAFDFTEIFSAQSNGSRCLRSANPRLKQGIDIRALWAIHWLQSGSANLISSAINLNAKSKGPLHLFESQHLMPDR